MTIVFALFHPYKNQALIFLLLLFQTLVECVFFCGFLDSRTDSQLWLFASSFHFTVSIRKSIWVETDWNWKKYNLSQLKEGELRAVIKPNISNDWFDPIRLIMIYASRLKISKLGLENILPWSLFAKIRKVTT